MAAQTRITTISIVLTITTDTFADFQWIKKTLKEELKAEFETRQSFQHAIHRRGPNSGVGTVESLIIQ